MANGFRCTICCYQETEHEDHSLALSPDSVCDHFTLSEEDQKTQLEIEKKDEEGKTMSSPEKLLFILSERGIDVLDIDS